MYGLQKGSELVDAFIKTPDENIVARYRVIQDEIYLDKLQVQIDKLQQQIDTALTPITDIPSGLSAEILRAIEDYNMMVPDLAELEEAKATLDELLIKALQAEPVEIER